MIPLVDIAGVEVPYDKTLNRYSVSHEGWIFILDLVDRQWTGIMTYLDVVIWQGTYPSLDICVERMEAFLNDLRVGLSKF